MSSISDQSLLNAFKKENGALTSATEKVFSYSATISEAGALKERHSHLLQQ